MKYLLTFGLLSAMTFSLSAVARDISNDDASKLAASGKIQSFDKLNQLVLAQHPGATIHDYELEEERNGYVYQVEVTDAQGVEWDLELDAATGAILENDKDD